jgi:hypothetical protein
MTAKIDAFIAEIQSRPEFIAGVAADPKKADDLAAMEEGLAVLYRDEKFIDALDKLEAMLYRRDLSMKQRLDEIGKILTDARDAGRCVN